MSTKVMALVVVMGAAGASPAEAQIGERAGRATGTVTPDRRGGAYHEHCWEGESARGREREIRCDERGRPGTAYGQSGRYDARDGRRDDRMGDRRDARHIGVVRAHEQVHDRLERLHHDWHRHYGWNGRSFRYRRDHEELHRRLRRMHDGWHRQAGWRADHRDTRWDGRF